MIIILEWDISTNKLKVAKVLYSRYNLDKKLRVLIC